MLNAAPAARTTGREESKDLLNYPSPPTASASNDSPINTPNATFQPKETIYESLPQTTAPPLAYSYPPPQGIYPQKYRYSETLLPPATASSSRRIAPTGRQSQTRSHIGDESSPPTGDSWTPEQRPLLSQKHHSERDSSRRTKIDRRHKSLSSGTTGSNALYGSFFARESSPTGVAKSFSPRDDFMKLGQALSPSTGSVRNISWKDGGGGFPHSPMMSSRRIRHMRQHSVQLYMGEFKGTQQETKCRDVVFLLFFVFHLIGMVHLNNTYGWKALNPIANTTNDITVHYMALLYVASISGAFGSIVSTSMLATMMFFPTKFVQITLYSLIGLSFIWGTMGVGLNPSSFVPITGFIALAMSVGYTFIVWKRVPFAAANLNTALRGIRAYPGTIMLAFFFQILTLVWCVFFCIILVGVKDAMNDGIIVRSHRMKVLCYVGLAVSFYWTSQVLQNTVQVATSAVIGQWWFQTENSNAVKRSTTKTIFYSMGSICFGSLFVGPMRLIRQLSAFFRPSSDDLSLHFLHQILRLFQTCLANVVDKLVDHCNDWSFTMIGLYGYGFQAACMTATEVFTKRGWTDIVSDDLVPNILMLTSCVIGGVTGVFAYTLASLDCLRVLSVGDSGSASLAIGAVAGFALTSVIFSMVSSSVNVVLVLFASDPMDFEKNHPELSREMSAAWREVWPGALDTPKDHTNFQQNDV